MFKAAATFLKSIPSRLVSVSSILSQHGVKLSNFSWAVWSEIIYRFLLLRHCILSSWKSVILIIYQNKRNPKQILNISRHGRLPRRWNYYWDSWLAGFTLPSSALSRRLFVLSGGGGGELVMSCHGHMSTLCGLNTPQLCLYNLDNCPHNQTNFYLIS